VNFFPAMAAGEKVELNGYAEYHKGRFLIVEGQRVWATNHTRFKGKGIYGLSLITLGYEVKVRGRRQADGTILAEQIEAKPNGTAMFEPDVLQATNQIEGLWVKEGTMFSEDSSGKRVDIGKIHDSGPEVERVRKIMARLVPPYVNPADLRVRVVETKEWNASAMGNGAIWVYSGLLREMSDDELAIILGHELAHYTYEHSRKGAKSSMLAQLLGLGAAVGGQAIGGAAGSATQVGGLLGMTVFQSGYSRDMEDQADRVGLRYAYEGGYAVSEGPLLWERFREKYGESDTITNFFVGSHSRPSDRIRNIEGEIALNYAGAR
jgi:Zn-dependent protease with chaperone function